MTPCLFCLIKLTKADIIELCLNVFNKLFFSINLFVAPINFKLTVYVLQRLK